MHIKMGRIKDSLTNYYKLDRCDTLQVSIILRVRKLFKYSYLFNIIFFYDSIMVTFLVMENFFSVLDQLQVKHWSIFLFSPNCAFCSTILFGHLTSNILMKYRIKKLNNHRDIFIT